MELTHLALFGEGEVWLSIQIILTNDENAPAPENVP